MSSKTDRHANYHSIARKLCHWYTCLQRMVRSAEQHQPQSGPYSREAGTRHAPGKPTDRPTETTARNLTCAHSHTPTSTPCCMAHVRCTPAVHTLAACPQRQGKTTQLAVARRSSRAAQQSCSTALWQVVPNCGPRSCIMVSSAARSSQPWRLLTALCSSATAWNRPALRCTRPDGVHASCPRAGAQSASAPCSAPDLCSA